MIYLDDSLHNIPIGTTIAWLRERRNGAIGLLHDHIVEEAKPDANLREEFENVLKLNAQIRTMQDVAVIYSIASTGEMPNNKNTK
jgi:hypothetical protein